MVPLGALLTFHLCRSWERALWNSLSSREEALESVVVPLRRILAATPKDCVDAKVKTIKKKKERCERDTKEVTPTEV